MRIGNITVRHLLNHSGGWDRDITPGGYDPMFIPEGEDRTMAQLTDEEKNAISHRGKAFRALRGKLASG